MSVTVSGIMINPVGEPVVNAQITLTAVANSLTVLNTFSATVRTDNTGAYRIQLEEGSYSITVAANGRSFVYGAVTLDDTTGPSTLNQLLKQQIMESELTPDVILYFRQIQQQVANDLATIKVLESSTSNSSISAGHSRDEARQYASDLSDALALAKGYRDTAVDSATAAAESAAHALESERIVIANANAAALSEANALQYKNYAQSAADEASTLAAEQTATKIKLAVKTDADRAEAAREDAETAQSAVDTQADEVNRLHTEVEQLAFSAAGSSNNAAQSATESESSKDAAAQSKQAAAAAASVAENSANAAVGFRDEAEEFAARAKVSAESIDVSVLEERINEKVSRAVFDEELALKASTQQLSDGLDTKLNISGGILKGELTLAGDGTKALNAATVGQLTGVVGTARNVSMNVNAASATASLVADEIIVQTAIGGLQYKIPNFNRSINLSIVGAGGMNAGSAPVTGFVAIYAILNTSSGQTALLAVNTTGAVAPEVCGVPMPTGYTASALVSIWHTASGLLVEGQQLDRTVLVSPTVVSSGSGNVTSQSFILDAVSPKNTKQALIESIINAAGSGNTTIRVASSDRNIGRLASQTATVLASLSAWVLVTKASNTLFLTTASGATNPGYNVYCNGYSF
ncbi:prophage tail fiber N-terminal domain-containing protein [Yersinia aleksiciae]|uniref:prophage tail fiber N-terminal domain-containing protein n=1 Tax=Yersinia aleksiciae TaxID=263819 RepID=UPI0011A07680|nr:prophage tail fiber N-terminal domain-containing protein [Yersinia aleksiciae]